MQVIENTKHKCILMVTYSAGLRLGEVVNLKTRDTDQDRMRILVHAGKGKKDRYTLLSRKAMLHLEQYMKDYRPDDWPFEGQDGGQYSKSSVQKVFRKALEKSKVNAYATVHTLRHSYAPHCVENGFSLALIQETLGHGSLKTTERYLHVSSQAMKKLKSPLDVLSDKMKK